MGTIEASSKEMALAMLQRIDLYVTSLKEEKPFSLSEIFKLKKKIPEKEIVLFTRQLAILVGAGVSLIEGLRSIALQTKNFKFRDIIDNIGDQIEGGSMLSHALSKFTDVFPPFYISVVKNGEMTGKLSYSLNFLAEYTERNYRFKENLRGILLYPIFVVVFSFLVLLFLTFFVFPTFENLIAERAISLPFVSKIVFSFSKFLRENILGFLLMFFGLIIFGISFLRREEGKELWDRYSLRIPFLGEILKQIYVTRIGENLSLLISSGLPITRAFELTADTVGNQVIKNILLVVKDEIKKGSSFSKVLAIYPEIFTPFFVQMVAVGERTGTLDKALMTVAAFHQKEVERVLEDFIKILEPILLILLGVFVGTIVGAVIIPIYRIVTSY